MKKLLFVLPLCVLLANCSSSKRATTPPAGPGISNVNVGTGGSAPTSVNSSATTTTNRDWSYTATKDTTLNGTWMLEGMLGASGSWTSTAVQTSSATADAQGTVGTAGTDMSATGSGSAGMSAGGTTTTDNSMAGGTTSGARTKTKVKTNRKALYDSARARLSIDPNSPPSTIDSSLVGPYKYWGNTPSMTINAANRVFSGSTGCNSMSGSFNFSGKDIQFGRTINTSKMNCNDYDEATFISALKKVDNYALNGDQLELRQGSTVLLTFKKRV
jgi:hypothetical protein